MKRILSFLLVSLMVVSSGLVVTAEGEALTLGENLLGFTYTFAANSANKATTSSDFSEMPTVTAYGDGVTSGTKEYGDDVTEKTADEALPALIDGNYFTRSEVVMAATTGTTEATSGDNNKTKNFKPVDNTAKMVKLAEGNGFEFNWSSEQTVSRLHLWVYPANVIKEYEIYIKNPKNKWALIKTGSLSYFEPDFKEDNSTFNAIVFNGAYSTKAVRFVVTDLVDGANEVYITEAVPRSTDAINLTSINPLGDKNTRDKTDSSQSIYVDKSALGYFSTSSNVNDATFMTSANNQYQNAVPLKSVYQANLAHNTTYNPNGTYLWRANSIQETGSTTVINKDPFYVADFGKTKVKINRLTLGNYSSKTGVVAYSLWCTDEPETYNTLVASKENVNGGWTQVGRWTNVSTSREDYYVPDAPEARYWKVVVELDGSITSKLKRITYYPEMYSVSEYDIPSATVTETDGVYVDGDTYRLNDDCRMTYKETRILAVDVLGENYNDSKLNNQTDKFVQFKNDGNKGIVWNYADAKTIKALDLWVYPAYAIKEYEVQKYSEGSWTKIADGNWNPGSASLGTKEANNTQWHSVVFDQPVTTDKIRFVINSFTDDTTGAYVAESNIRENDAINLIATESAQNDGQPYSIYPYQHKATTGDGVKSTDNNAFWRSWPSDNVVPYDNAFWYAVSFGNSRHKINRVGLNVEEGTVKSFEIWNSNTSSAYSNAGGDDNWTKVATVSGNYTGNDLVFDIPDSVEAAYWKIKITDYDENAKLSVAELYELSTSTLNTTGKFGELSADGYIALDIDKLTNGAVGETSADVYYALYNGETLEGITTSQDLALDSAQNYVVYKAPANVTGNHKLRTFIWNSSLKPLRDDFTIE